MSARRERRLGALLLESAEIRDPDAGACKQAALAGLRAAGHRAACRGLRNCGNGRRASC